MRTARARRCRLEQWGHMCVWGNENMLFYDAKADKLRPLGDAEDEDISQITQDPVSEPSNTSQSSRNTPNLQALLASAMNLVTNNDVARDYIAEAINAAKFVK